MDFKGRVWGLFFCPFRHGRLTACNGAINIPVNH
ncbi:hypothetical protein HWC07_gp130 [Pantoea phage vB_PagM_LIET2]|uniref:Uncharacterized protein n=1 Tax=Pantoea phage vB_PagM_LIET2 TaxID=2508071 RepID=A0A411AWA3_9CAUD|nr:hypothetical protein HWC07_gp130 [Pantoea phage vB_PagM_LIET2]QAX92382.1 hypothetical protein LIET2_gp130 [Pantoea phage vB_PagM_LIET2]